MARKGSAGFGGYIEMLIHYGRLVIGGFHVGLGSRNQKPPERPPERRETHDTPPL